MRPHSRNGFTLIEVIGALVLFASGVIVAGMLSNSLTRQMRNAAIRSEATAIGIATLDSLGALTYADFTDGSSVSNTVTLEGISYTRSWDVTQVGLRVLAVALEVESPVTDGPTFTGSVYHVEAW